MRVCEEIVAGGTAAVGAQERIRSKGRGGMDLLGLRHAEQREPFTIVCLGIFGIQFSSKASVDVGFHKCPARFLGLYSLSYILAHFQVALHTDVK